MARKVLLETGYTFTPSTKTITIPRVIPRERMVLITNVTTNQVIYNFSDPNLKATSYTTSAAANANTTTIVLNYNTASMSSTDKLQITIDEYDEKFTPSETYIDPVNKFRTSQPQALIDTDFEYGTQITKWENLSQINNRPSAFPQQPGLIGVGTITMPTNSRTVTIQSNSNFGANGTMIFVQDAVLPFANGLYMIESGGGTGVVTYTARATNTTAITSLFDTNKTQVFSGSYYTNSLIGISSITTNTGVTTAVNAVTVTTTVPHGLSIGNEIAVSGITGTNAPNGNFFVSSVKTPTQFLYYSIAAGTPSGIGSTTGSALYIRPPAQYLHRAFDGGVIFSTNASSNYQQATRQTRRYFRYQSGKGIQMSSGTMLKPGFQIDSLTASGTAAGSVISVQTKEPHNKQGIIPGLSITMGGANESGYNGTFTVNSVTGISSFTYLATSGLSTTVASGPYYVNINNWDGCANRLGIFDQQNGLFFEFDGRTLFAVRRNSTFQISGKVSVTVGSNTVTQTDPTFPTAFSRQLVPGDYIVIRGQSYRVIDIASDTSLTISPSYRGTTNVTYGIVSKTVDTKIPQSSWNLDKCDGTGPSGFNIDLTKMQMFYIDFSWYGAGFIRWGVRGPDGGIIYCHKQANNNANNEAYMRSGNLPGRYESITQPPTTIITSSIATTDTTVGIASTAGFPSSGTVVIRDSSKYEYVNYTGITTNSLTGLTRAGVGATSLALTVSAGSNVATASTAGLQIGQRVISLGVPDNTFITSIGNGTFTMSNAVSVANTTVSVCAMGATTAQAFTYSPTTPVTVEYAYPTFAPTISHWGTSVIMDGRFDDDKSLVFTYGQTGATGIATASSKALFSIRLAPSVDQGIAAAFGTRELTNRMQLTLKGLDLTTSTVNANLLVRAYLNSTPSTTNAWTNAVGNVAGVVNSSLAQIADYSSASPVSVGTTVIGGEVAAGFFVGSGANAIDLSNVRDLGNSIVGGGGTSSNTQIYPDGPDTLTIVVTNLSTQSGAAATVFGRLSWTEAQA
jgi:hypothetical protein